jgi:hypothetical protein
VLPGEEVHNTDAQKGPMDSQVSTVDPWSPHLLAQCPCSVLLGLASARGKAVNPS